MIDINSCQNIKDAEVHIQYWRQICGARLSIVYDGSVYPFRTLSLFEVNKLQSAQSIDVL